MAQVAEYVHISLIGSVEILRELHASHVSP